jgi:hypothetical protein
VHSRISKAKAAEKLAANGALESRTKDHKNWQANHSISMPVHLRKKSQSRAMQDPERTQAVLRMSAQGNDPRHRARGKGKTKITRGG